MASLVSAARSLFSKEADSGKVPNRELLNYAFGLTGQNVAYSYQSAWLNYFCVNMLKIAPEKVGGVFFASHFWDAVNDPLIGGLIDRRRFSSGEKLRPFLLYLPPIIGVLTALMFMQVPLNSSGALIYILLVYLVWDLIYSVEDVALWGMVAVVSPDSNERGRVAQWVSIGASAGGVIAGAFGAIRGFLNNVGLSDTYVFAIFGILFGLGGQLIVMRAHKARERVHAVNQEQESVRETLAMLFKNKKLLVISLARILGNVFPKLGAIYFFENCMEVHVGSLTLSGNTMFTLFPLLAGAPSAIAIFFANKLAIRIGGMKKLLIFAKTIEIVSRVLSFLVGMNGGYNSVGKLLIIILLNAIMGIPTSMMDIGHRALTSDGIDELELETGRRSEGVAFSTQNFVSKLNGGITSLIEGFTLKFLGYDNSDGAVQSESFKSRQWPLYVLSPALGALLYVIAIAFIKDDRDKQAEISSRLIEMRSSSSNEAEQSIEESYRE